jgi:hypothetical protein
MAEGRRFLPVALWELHVKGDKRTEDDKTWRKGDYSAARVGSRNVGGTVLHRTQMRHHLLYIV